MTTPTRYQCNPATGERIRWLLRADETDGELARLEMWAAPGGGVLGTHVHPHTEERFEVLSGRLVLESGGRQSILLRGECATVPAGIAHRWRNGGDGELHMIIELDRPGRFEEMLDAAFAAGRSGGFDGLGRMKPLPALALLRNFPDVIAPPWPAWLRRLATGH